MDFRTFIEGQIENIKNLQPNTVLTVFHGTTQEHAYDFCLNGIDAKKFQQYRLYPHFSGGKKLKFGLFVAPNLKTAQKFGNTVLKFKSLGKDLIYRFPTEMKKDEKYYKDKFPKSFRPTVSQDMADLSSVEPQAIYVGLLSPRAIEKVWMYDYQGQWNTMSPKEFIKLYESKNPKTRTYKGLFEPQERNIELKDFVKRVAKDNNSSEEETLEILKDVYKRYGYLTGIGNLPYSLLKRIENQVKKLII